MRLFAFLGMVISTIDHKLKYVVFIIINAGAYGEIKYNTIVLMSYRLLRCKGEPIHGSM